MKAKTIRKVIARKIEQWTSSIDDEAVRKLVKRDTVVTGGCIASMLLNEPVNDYDVYFKTKETAAAVAKYYVARFDPAQKRDIDCEISVDESIEDRVRVIIKSAGIASEDGTKKEYEYFESRPAQRADDYVSDIIADPGEIQDVYEQTEEAAQKVEDDTYRPVFISTNAITLSGKIQVVLRFFGEPDKLHENYDFQHCMNYWTSKDDKVVLKPEALECLLSRELVYVGSKYPICSIIRLRKFIKRGWTVNAGQILKMCLQISKLDLEDRDVLEEQLTGVDMAYFAQVLRQATDADPKRINSAYLVEIIDRVF